MNRSESIGEIENTPIWDIVIIGGGATGLGCAIDAAHRGYKTLLIEQYDFAKGTSSKATKLLHGGVRYLAQGNIKLVKEALRERSLLLQNAPDLCEIENFIIPCFNWWQKIKYGIGLKIYDLLAGKYSLGKTMWLSKKETIQLLPDLKPNQLVGGILYKDGQFDDARLAIALANTATHQGATVINYVKLEKCTQQGKLMTTLQCRDTIDQKDYYIQTKTVINATGVFAVITEKIFHTPQLKIVPSQGVHIVVGNSFFEGSEALMIPKTNDGRVLFALPWQGKRIIGTTDTAVNEINLEPKAQQDEIDFIIQHFNQYCNKPISYNDIESVFTGLRPLIKKEGVQSTKSLNRSHVISIHQNIITITGGKWTTYRQMAEDVLNKVADYFQKNDPTYFHKHLMIHASKRTKNLPLLIGKLTHQGVKLHPQYHFTIGDLIESLQDEMIQSPEDFLARRIRLLFLDVKASLEIIEKVTHLMAQFLKKDEKWEIVQVNQYKKLTEFYTINKIESHE